MIFSYTLTDLTDIKSDPIKVTFESDDEAVAYGSDVARQMLERMPYLTHKGMCVTVLDELGETLTIVPLDTIN